MKNEMKRKRKGISYIEMMIAFTIFLIGVSVILYFFIPFFKPEYRVALNVIEKKFDENFIQKVNISKLVLNESVECANLGFSFPNTNTLIYNKSFYEIGYSNNGNAVLDANYELEFYVYEFEQSVDHKKSECEEGKVVKAAFTPKIVEEFINLEKFRSDQTYDSLKQTLIPGFNLDFNITIILDSRVISIGKPLAKTNIFSKEKFYKVLDNDEDNKKIKTAKVRFYVW